MINVRLKEIEVYHGAKVVSNDCYIEHFKKQGKDVEHFFKDVTGRNTRYFIDTETEGNLTMAKEACSRVLNKAGLSGEDIDMIVYSSALPEYAVPACALHLHAFIGGKNQCVCYDFNANCAGMTVALEHTAKYMQLSDTIQTVLVVGCDYVSYFMDKDSEYCYGHYGDASCAYILEKTEDDCGLLGAKFFVNSSERNNILFPSCGFSNLFKADREELYLDWIPFENVAPPVAAVNMSELLAENGLTTGDVSMFCFSQYALAAVKAIRSLLSIDEERSLFVGDEYGYTGTSSPFLVLYEALNRGKVHRGDYIMFWTIGAGSQHIALLFKY